MIQPSIRQIVASDGYCLSFRHWNVPSPRGIVVATHGIQSHSGWYEYSSRRMAEAGFAVYFADRRGSGLNGLQRGHAAHAMRLVNDVRAMTQLAVAENSTADGRLPVTLLGLSWGAKIAAATAAIFPEEYQRLVLLYPGLEPRIKPTVWQSFRLRIARELDIVKRHIPVPLCDPAMFTGVTEWQRFIANDPLALHTVTSSFLNAGVELDGIVERFSSRICQPTLVMLAGRDSIIHNVRVQRRLITFGSPNVLNRNYPNAFHTLEFEPNREAIFSDLVHWLQASMTGLPG